MKFMTLCLITIAFLFSFLAEAGMMSQIDYKTRQQIKEDFANAHRVEVQGLRLDVGTDSKCDVQVQSQALVKPSAHEQSVYDCLTCFTKVDIRVFQVNRPLSSCKMAKN